MQPFFSNAKLNSSPFFTNQFRSNYIFPSIFIDFPSPPSKKAFNCRCCTLVTNSFSQIFGQQRRIGSVQFGSGHLANSFPLPSIVLVETCTMIEFKVTALWRLSPNSPKFKLSMLLFLMLYSVFFKYFNKYFYFVLQMCV